MDNNTTEQLDRDSQIYQITTMVAGDLKLQDVLDRIAELAVRITGTTASSIRLLDDEAGELKMCSTYGLSAEYRNKGPVSKSDPVIKAAFEGQEVVLDDMRVDARVKYPQAIIKEGLISQLTVAMIFRKKPIGVLRIYSPEPNKFDKSARAVARLVASQCAVAITNARLYREAIEGEKMAEQMRLAALIQRRMIPEKLPCICGLDMAAIYKPCFHIGGDLYDFIQLDDHTVAVAIADVIGKGIPAAMMMSMFRGTLRAYADGGHGRHSMLDIVTMLNKVACRECRNGEFITLFVAKIDTRNMEVTYCNCGHEPGLLFRGDDIIELDEGGLVLGVLEDAEYDIGTVQLKEKDCLFMYTDGLIDAVNFKGDLWGKEEMLKVAKDHLKYPSEQMIRSILRYRRRFVGLARQTDDTSIVAIRLDRESGKSE